MDPITTAIIVALGKLGENVIKDAYEALKAALAAKCGLGSDLVRAVENLERKPDSTGRQETLKEEVAAAKVDRDAELLQLAQSLLNKSQFQSGQATFIQQRAGNQAIQIGQINGSTHITTKGGHN